MSEVEVATPTAAGREISAATSHFVSAPDGLRLHYRSYGGQMTTGFSVVCLPGLARTAGDFDRLATALSSRPGPKPRRVLALDYRGRGLSDRDPDPTHYDLKVESGDVLAVLTAAGVQEAVFIGTSRGGLITMILAALRPGIIRGAVLNDIGPVLEAKGLARIRNYVGKLPQPRSWSDAVDILKGLGSSHFTGLSDAEWRFYAELTFTDEGGRFKARYDPALMATLRDLDLDDLPTLWPQFDGLAHVPVLVVRGQNSDLLSPATTAEMQRRHPDCAVHTVAGQGHAPLLTDVETIGVIADFVKRCESRPAPGAVAAHDDGRPALASGAAPAATVIPG